MKATLDHIEDIAQGIKTFWFKPEKPVQYVAGQFTELYLPHDNPDTRGVKHWFTLSSSPTDPLLSITTKFPVAPQQTSTFKQTLLGLPVGTEVNLAEPMGDFVLPKDASIPLVFVAGGIGVTPAHSMVKYLQDTGEKRNIRLLYAVSVPEELAFTELFKTYPLQFMPTAKSPAPGWEGEVGGLTVGRIQQELESPNTLVYLSGPEPMIEALNDSLIASGVGKQNLVTDFFPGYPDV